MERRSLKKKKRYELNKLTSLPMCGFIAQLVEHRTGIAEVTGSNPVEALIFFRLLLSNCLNWKIYCDDHSSLSLLKLLEKWNLRFYMVKLFIQTPKYCYIFEDRNFYQGFWDAPFALVLIFFCQEKFCLAVRIDELLTLTNFILLQSVNTNTKNFPGSF